MSDKTEQQKNPLGDPQKAAMVKALERHMGIVTKACVDVGISRTTHYEWMKTDPIYKAAVEELREVVLDFCEHKLHTLIETGDTAATIFALKSLGKSRGYGEHIKIEHSHANKTDEELDAEIAARLGKKDE